MSKRYQQPKEFGRNTKKAKLEYVSRPGTSKAALAINSSPNNFWDDEDDDVILLATQVAEQRQEVAADFQGSEISFSEFGANLKAATSTQHPPKPTRSSDKILSQMLDDSDDDAFSNLDLPNEDIFKKPPAPGPANSIEVKQNSTLNSHPLMGETDVAVRRQFAMEQQMKYLSTRMAALVAENKKLNQELISSKDSVISKSGEASLLRDELRNTKQQVQQLKMERLKSKQIAQSEAQSKMDQLNRTIETREAQLQMKSAECASLKMRHADETRRFDESMRHDVSLIQQQDTQQPTTSKADAAAAAAVITDLTEDELQIQLPLELQSYENMLADSRNIAFTGALRMHANVYMRTEESGSLIKPRSMVEIEFQELQLLLVQLLYCNGVIPNHNEINIFEKIEISLKTRDENIKQKILKGACKIFYEFSNYVQRLEYPKPQRFYAYIEYEFERDNFNEKRSILQPTELYANERSINMRRYFAALALACAQSVELAEALLLQRHDNGELLLKIASDAIEQLGYSIELNDHFGLLEAFAVLLNILIVQTQSTTSSTTLTSTATTMSEEAVHPLVELFKQLVFTRPSPWVFRELSGILYEVMTRCEGFLEFGFCYNSPASCFTLMRDSGVYRFTPDSCVLQVYAGILHTLFPLYTEIESEHYCLLIDLCYQYVHFLFRCFCLPPKFLFNFVRNYDENPDDISPEKTSGMTTDDGQATTTTSEEITCECYVSLCLSALSLIYQVLYYWQRKDKELGETIEVERISHLAVQLLHIIFCENYMTSLLSESEQTTRHQFHMVCSWWTDNSELLNFGITQIHFLDKLKQSHIMPGLLIEGRYINKEEEREKFHNLTDGILKEDDEVIISDADAAKEVLDDSCNPEKFFQFMTGYAFNFE